MGVIEPVSHSKWASPIVVIKKKETGKIRACGDFKVSGLNKALLEEYHPLPTSEDIFGTLKGSVFSQIDLRDAYLQVELDEESQKVVVINTHKGLFKYKRMAFGLKTAPAIFQKIVDKMIAGIPGVAAYLDDVIVSAESHEEHEKTLTKLFQRLQEYGFRVSPDKCSFAKNEIRFLGFIVDKHGRRPDPSKTEAIRNMKAPTDQKQLASFLGGICFYSRFIPELSTLRGPLDGLMKKDAKWSWGDREQKAFESLTAAVAQATMLSHFHESWPIIVSADASNYGIGGVLTHVNPEGVELPVAHFARSLTDTEKRYSQIEKEALALVYTVKKCHKFIFGRRFTLHTDHRPLLALFGSNKDLPVHAQNRVVRWAMTLMSYDFDITYVNTTKFAKADWLSRVIQEYPKNEDDIVIAEVDMEDAVDDWNSEDVTPVLETHIRNASAEDKELTEVMDLVENNAWKLKPKSEVEKSWHHVKDRLKLIRNCLLLDDRVVVPKVLQAKVLQQLHEGHPGVVKMKHKARSFVYWKGLDSQIEKVVQNCCSCQENAKMPRVVPLKPWPVPEAVWKRVHVDFAGPVDGLWFLVVVDAKSKYAEVKLTRSISAVATVDLLDEVFSVHGYPELIVSDNGTQFTSQFFQDMCTSYGISHKTTAVYYPRSNGAAERFVDTLKRGIAKIRETGSVNQQLLNKFLINYRNSPHASLNGATPAEVHFNRKIRVKMSLLLPRERVEAASELTPYQDKMKSAYDKRNAARANSFQVGQSVYARVQHGNKFSWEYGEIRRRIGSVLYEVQVGARIQRCHVNQLRQRFGDKSPEELFTDSIFPLFFEAPATTSPVIARGRGDNHSDFADMDTFDDVFNDVGSPGQILSPMGLTSSGPSPVQSELNTPRNFTPRERIRRQSDILGRLDETSEPPVTPTATATPLVVPRNLPVPTLSHSLRRSHRIRNAPNRFDPCAEIPPVSNRGAQRGSSNTNDQLSTRGRGSHNALNVRMVPGQNQTGNSQRGGGIREARGRPRWNN
ncbi:hypothetical protein CAEBREN_22921 [Caenorhabditis brenneri]|uniref:RNA-directed DNA polymerase n=1 Tax=Caenorhabditis brenneri TaxID=135651 RepID=G0NBE3_CAEBE|nr:hypothetical protein CAEBREN_22921 [Caenorhabditis brenneri]